ncbi:MAG: zinc ribbon domain-containing protein [Phycisphaerales bacterium]|nr:zinc ribbon domain-containing protein [Phycisphaerales bacterium]
MPTYDYKCNACDHRFELFQSMSEGVKKKCPECGKLKLERLIGTGSALIFKGSGFYETDYRSKDYAKAKEADSKAAMDSTKSNDSKAKKSDEAKPKKSEKTESKPKAKSTSDA